MIINGIRLDFKPEAGEPREEHWQKCRAQARAEGFVSLEHATSLENLTSILREGHLRGKEPSKDLKRPTGNFIPMGTAQLPEAFFSLVHRGIQPRDYNWVIPPPGLKADWEINQWIFNPESHKNMARIMLPLRALDRPGIHISKNWIYGKRVDGKTLVPDLDGRPEERACKE